MRWPSCGPEAAHVAITIGMIATFAPSKPARWWPGLLFLQVILTADVPEVGKEGQLLTVPVGFFRNFLLPNKVAKRASEAILE
jgi:Ribosomal protein L9, N-terminal domain